MRGLQVRAITSRGVQFQRNVPITDNLTKSVSFAYFSHKVPAALTTLEHLCPMFLKNEKMSNLPIKSKRYKYFFVSHIFLMMTQESFDALLFCFTLS